MGVEHYGVTFAIDRHSCVRGLSVQRLLFFHQIKDTAGEKEFLEPSGVREKSGENSSLPFALNQEAIRPLEKACSYQTIEKMPFFGGSVHVPFY
jgi:hypothetical protein